jgi:regulatory protein
VRLVELHPSSPRARPPRRRDDTEPLDAAWLERKAIEYAARWESTRQGVAELLERKIREHCDRTNEAPEAALALIPEVVERLAARGYVNDHRAATHFFERLRRQGRSSAQISAFLLRKGVTESMLLELTRDEDPEAELHAAWRTARRRSLGPHCTDPDRRAAQRDRHIAMLARQGFSREIVFRVIDAETAVEPV